MQILVVGSGGREHAIVWKLSQSGLVSRLFTAPGNAGTIHAPKNENVRIPAEDVEALVAFASSAGVDLTIVGPEKPLALGIVDRFTARGLKIFGPTQAAARLESSKSFAKEVMDAAEVPTARYQTFDDLDSTRKFLASCSYPVVLKEDGLAQGKGVLVAENLNDALLFAERTFKTPAPGEPVKKLVVEDFLKGDEASFFVVCDGHSYVPLTSAQDHKRLLDGDRGPNTGGMGAYSPAPILDAKTQAKVETSIVQPVLQEMERRRTPYRGVLYVGLMLTPEGPKVLEFNARFGDPETEVVLPRLESDLAELLDLSVRGHLAGQKVRWSSDHAITIVLASEGYPSSPRSGDEILGLDQLPNDAVAFHAGTHLDRGRVVTNGGRVLAVTARASSLKEARDRAYQAVARISFKGMQYRSDIGHHALR